MTYDIDTQDARENEQYEFPLVPEGTYEVMLTEKADNVTKEIGDPMVKIVCEIQQGEFKNYCLFDNIVIPLVGSPSFKIMGRTMHFLHVLGEPYQGQFKTNSDNWLWKKFNVKVKHGTIKKGFNAGKPIARIVHYMMLETLENNKSEDESDIPF